jgi:hypothetical protein
MSPQVPMGVDPQVSFTHRYKDGGCEMELGLRLCNSTP